MAEYCYQQCYLESSALSPTLLVISTEASLFSELTAPFPRTLAVSAECLKLLWLTPGHICKESSTQAGDLAGRSKRKDRFAKNPSLLASKNQKRSPPPRLPWKVYVLKFRFATFEDTNMCSLPQPSQPPVVALPLSRAWPSNRFSFLTVWAGGHGLVRSENGVSRDAFERRCWSGLIRQALQRAKACSSQPHKLGPLQSQCNWAPLLQHDLKGTVWKSFTK